MEESKKKDLKKEKLEENLLFKAERIFAKNWFVIAFLTICMTMYALYVSEKTANAIEKLQNTVYTNNLYTIITTIDGRSIKVKKTKLEPKFIEKWLAKTIVSNFIVSRSELTNNFTVNDFSAVSNVIKNSAKLQFIYNELMSKDEAQSKKDLRTYLFELQGLLAENKLPEFITVNNYYTDYFRFKENTFDMKVVTNILSLNYDLSRDEKYEQKGNIPIIITGYVDLSKSTELNPYGLIIKSFKIGVMVKAR